MLPHEYNSRRDEQVPLALASCVAKRADLTILDSHFDK